MCFKKDLLSYGKLKFVRQFALNVLNLVLIWYIISFHCSRGRNFCYFYFEENSCNHFRKLKINYIFLDITVVPKFPVKQIFTDALSLSLCLCVCVCVCVCTCVFILFHRAGFLRLECYGSTMQCCGHYFMRFCQVLSSPFLKMSYFTSKDETPACGQLESKRCDIWFPKKMI